MLALVCAPLLVSAGCKKKQPGEPGDTGAISAMDRAGGKTAEADTSPLPGVELGGLASEQQPVFYKLIDSLPSPCGKTHSLRTSFTQDTSCKRAPYAVKYVLAILEDEQPERTVRELYAAKYEKTPEKVTFDLSKAPRVGKPDAPVRLVEFFDYACPHCAMFAPVLAKVAENQKDKVVEYFMMFPIEAAHPESRSAAKAALAASQLGKFKEMHTTLFERSPMHAKGAVTAYATQLGLDPAQFEAAYTAADAQVSSDLAQGERAGVNSTPTLFFNDRKYEGPLDAKYIEMWIEEEIAVNR